MHATIYGGARAPATAVAERKRVKPRKSIFDHFMDGLKEFAARGGSPRD